MEAPPKFIKDKNGDMITNPEYLKWKKAQDAEPPTAALAATKLGGDAANNPASLMDKAKDLVTDKKFLGGAGIGFLAGAATGAAITHVVHKKKKKKKRYSSSSSSSSSSHSSSSSSSSSDSDY